jgi:hypothetical protein
VAGERPTIESWGAVPGAAYAVLRDQLPALGAGHGLLYGARLWTVNDEYLNARLGLSAPPAAYPLMTHVRGLATSPSGWRMPALGRLFVRVLLRLVGARDVLADPVRAAATRPAFELRPASLTVPHARLGSVEREGRTLHTTEPR